MLESLHKKSSAAGSKMLEAQEIAGAALRGTEPRTPAVQRLINTGFKYEFLAFKAADALKAFKVKMRNKYSSV
jgi:hypothetical protein